MKTINYSNFFKIIIIFLLVGTSVGGYFYFYRQAADLQVKIFNKQQDTSSILNWFEVDQYWLTNNPEFSAQFMIDHMTPKQDPAFFGKQNILMLYFKDIPAGFGACYMKNFYEGWIHFLYIDRQFRGKDYSKILMKNMIDLLFSKGAKIIKLYTRVNNMPARTLYKKLGFDETGPDEQGFMLLEMRK